MSPPKRQQSQAERDREGLAKRRERERELFPIDLPDEITGKYEGEELQMYREQRDPTDRLTRIELKHDSLVDSVTGWRTDMVEQIGEVTGAIGALTGEVKGLATVVKTLNDREHIKFTATVDVEKAKQLDQVDEKKAKRDKQVLWLKIIAGVFTGGLLGKILHTIGIF